MPTRLQTAWQPPAPNPLKFSGRDLNFWRVGQKHQLWTGFGSIAGGTGDSLVVPSPAQALVVYRDTSLIRKRIPLYDHHKALGIGLLQGSENPLRVLFLSRCEERAYLRVDSFDPSLVACFLPFARTLIIVEINLFG
jgi:hypothetical protein